MRRLGRMGLGLGVGLVPPQPAVSGGGGGGGGAPDWLPTGAIDQIDFVNNRAYTTASGIVALSAAVGDSDPSTGYTGDAFNAGLLVPSEGYTAPYDDKAGGAIIGDVLATISAGCRAVIQLEHYENTVDGTTWIGQLLFALYNDGYADDIALSANGGISGNHVFSEENTYSFSLVGDAMVVGPNKFALELASGSWGVSHNGSAALANATYVLNAPIDRVDFEVQYANELKSITTYPLIYSDLPTLSALPSSTDLQLRTDGSARLRTDGSKMLRT